MKRYLENFILRDKSTKMVVLPCCPGDSPYGCMTDELGGIKKLTENKNPGD
jgi:hypothetical protein